MVRAGFVFSFAIWGGKRCGFVGSRISKYLFYIIRIVDEEGVGRVRGRVCSHRLFKALTLRYRDCKLGLVVRE